MNGLTSRRYGFIGLVAVVILGGVVLFAMSATSPAMDVRELRLVARDMTFFVADEKTPNPTLRFRAGELVRVVLRNEDAGMQHDFAIKNWNVGSALLNGKGETVFEFRVPDKRGPEAYSCTPHPVMMRGSIDVE